MGASERPIRAEAQGLQKYNQISINKVANGFIIAIGCQTFVSETWEKVVEGLTDYYKDPIAAQKKYCK
jgi:hypothetical protein